MSKLAELLLLLAALFTAAALPTFLFATKIDRDEFQKSGTSIVLIGAVVTAYRCWKKQDQ